MIVIWDMKTALGGFLGGFLGSFLGVVAAVLALLAAPAFAGAPALNVQKICKTRDADAKMLKSVEECVRDEEAAKQQLNSIWDATPARSRNQCVSDARALGTTSYVDLLTCLQVTEDLQAEARKQNGKK